MTVVLRSLRQSIFLASLAGIAGCAGPVGTSDPSRVAAGTAVASGNQETASSTPRTVGEPVIRELQRVERVNRQVIQLQIDGDLVAWLEAAHRANPTEVMLYSRATGTLRTIASVPAGTGSMNRVCIASDGPGRLVYTVTKSGANPNLVSEWEMVLVDLRTSEEKVIAAEASSTRSFDVPVPDIAGHWVAWAQADQPGTASVLAYNVDTGDRETVVTHGHPGEVYVLGDAVVYSEEQGSTATEIRLASLTGGPTVTLAPGHNASSLIVRHGALAWQEAQSGDHAAQWYMRSPQDQPLEVATSRYGTTTPSPQLVMWYDDVDGTLQARTTAPALSAATRVEGTKVSIGARWDADASTMVWAVPTKPGPGGNSVLHIAELSSS